MSIERKCENCIYYVDGIGEQNCCKNKNATISTPRVFIPKEEAIRQDEKNKIISIIKEAKENYDVNNQNISTNNVVIFQFFNLLMEQELDKIIELIEKRQ